MAGDGTATLSRFGMDRGYQRLLDTSVDVFAGDARVGALFAVGSVGRGAADASSDLDLLVVSLDRDAHADLVETWKLWLAAITPTVYRRLLHGTVVTAVTDDWLRLDISVVEPTVVPLLTSGPATVIFDALGVDPPGEPPPAAISAEALVEKVENFLRSVGLLATDEVRGEFTILTWANELLIQELVDLFFIDAGRPRRTVKRIHVDLPARYVRVLNSLPRAEPNRESALRAHLAVAAEFLPLARRLLQERGGQWPSALEEATDRHLRQRLDIGLPASAIGS